jgi:HSP20 family protein
MMEQDAFRELQTMSDRLNRLIAGGGVPSRGSDESMAVVDWIPAVNVVETNEDFRILAELPGVEKNAVKLSIEDGVLMISGYRQQEQEDKGTRYHRTERSYGRFERGFTVPDIVDEQKLEAELKNGILTIRLPKLEKARPKSIEVTVT